jgi:hypothetical protein
MAGGGNKYGESGEDRGPDRRFATSRSVEKFLRAGWL